jgi:thioredoxin-dependent peroxiredoxin
MRDIAMTDVGQPAPDFTLPRDGGGEITLSALRPKAVVLYFYPKDDTSGCTAEAQGFTEHGPPSRPRAPW